ncbi:MAG TPA: hypothetical protein VM820_03355 [Vicinamibacterales bacterium]|nr:hypothetical protein [Vicinamibacterales bacterium]
MIRWLLSLAGLVLFLFALAMVVGTSGCKPVTQPTAAQAAAEGAYGAALVQCVDQAKTLAESKSCRAQVDAEWGVVQVGRDGGR